MVFADAAGSLPVGAILMGLLGGLALFLFGMDQMADALKLGAPRKLVERKQLEIVLRAVAPSLEAITTEGTEQDLSAVG